MQDQVPDNGRYRKDQGSAPTLIRDKFRRRDKHINNSKVIHVRTEHVQDVTSFILEYMWMQRISIPT